MSLKKITEIIKNKKSFLLSTHQDVEGDALGSELALFSLLRRLRKEVYIYNSDKTPLNYRFLPFSSYIKNEPPQKEFEVGIVVDASDISRIGIVRNSFLKTKILINIDHHISNTKFGDINWIEPKVSSAAEMVYKIYKRFFPNISKNASICLYTGIFTDTGCFSYSYTNSQVHRIVSELLNSGVTPVKIYHEVYSSFKARDISFVGRVLSRVKCDFKGKVCWVKTSQWKDSSSGDLTEAIFYNLRFIKDAEVLILFKQIGKNVRVNFRSKGKIDVNRVAKFFGGGGHKSAAGTTLKNTSIFQAQKKVLSFIKSHIL